MEIRNLIPKDKGDFETAEKLKNYSYEEIKPIIPELLEWLQDGNWPISKMVAEYLETICENISSEILEVFKTNDLEWQYYIIFRFGLITNDNTIRDIIIRIASNPTINEKNSELNEIAKEIVEKRNWN